MNYFTILLKLTAASILGLFSWNFKLQRIDVQKPSTPMVTALQTFEKSFVYPFSEHEEFTIQHGRDGDYFSFFKQLGDPYYYTLVANKDKAMSKKIGDTETMVQQKAGEVAAAGCCILRTMNTTQGNPLKAWYLCDLKVDPKYQGEHLPLLLVKKIGLLRFVQCPRGYAVCMNPAHGDPKAASIFKKHGPIKGIKTQTLNLYTLNAEQLKQQYDYLEQSLREHGSLKVTQKLGLVSTSGAKDYMIINKQTGATRFWNLQHLVPVNDTSVDLNLQPDATYMICSIDGTPLDEAFKSKLGAAPSTAQIVSYGMDNVDFNTFTSNQI